MPENTDPPRDQDGSTGEVSESAGLAGAGEEIMPDQSVAGAPDADSGEAQEGRQGPNAQTGSRDPAHRNPSDD